MRVAAALLRREVHLVVDDDLGEVNLGLLGVLLLGRLQHGLDVAAVGLPAAQHQRRLPQAKQALKNTVTVNYSESLVQTVFILYSDVIEAKKEREICNRLVH